MEFLSAATLLFFIIDPFGNLPIFNSILSKYPAARQRRILIRETLIALAILLAFLFLGNHVLSFLKLEQPTLSISGGVILFLIALGMIFPSRNVLPEDSDEEPFIVPLAVPLIAGPSCIAYLLLLASKFPDRTLDWAAALSLAWLLASTIFFFGPNIFKHLGRKGSRALERLMGMLLIMLSVQMLLDGITLYLDH